MATEVNITKVTIGRINTKCSGIFTTDKGQIIPFNINYNRASKKIRFMPRLKPQFLEDTISEKIKPFF